MKNKAEIIVIILRFVDGCDWSILFSSRLNLTAFKKNFFFITSKKEHKREKKK